jgi:hypothetical protein
MRSVDPQDIQAPYWIEGHFLLDPVANIPGRGAMRIPVGLAPGALASMASYLPEPNQQHPWSCESYTVTESYSIQFPDNVVITSIPDGVVYHDDQVDFKSTYRQVGRHVSVERTLVVQRPSQVCNADERARWRAFYLRVQRDLRSQIFYQ